MSTLSPVQAVRLANMVDALVITVRVGAGQGCVTQNWKKPDLHSPPPWPQGVSGVHFLGFGKSFLAWKRRLIPGTTVVVLAPATTRLGEL